MTEPVPIEDPSDPRVAAYVAMRERDLVGRHGRFIVEGEVTLRALLSSPARFGLESVLVAPERWEGLREILAQGAPGVPTYLAARTLMGAVTGFPIHRGVLAVGLRGPGAAPETLLPPPPAPALALGLVGLTNHDNVGGVFRNAAAFGVDAVLLDAATCDPLYRKAIRVSAGGVLRVPFARLADAAALLTYAGTHGLEPIALTPGGEEDIADIAPPRRALLLLGTEGPGLPRAVLARTRRVRIAMAPGFDSLNVATAGAVALHRLRVAKRDRTRDNPLQLPHP